MATKILVRRGVVADLDQETLDEGELAFTKDELGLYVGTDAVTEGFIKVNKTGNIEYDGNALTSATDTDNLKEAVQNIDAALKVEQDNVDTLQADLDTLESDVSTLTTNFNTHTHGTINNDGTLTAASVTPATGDELVVVDADDDKLKKAIAIDANGTGYLKEDGTWSIPDVEDLANVTLTNIQDGEVLKYSNGSWVNLPDTDLIRPFTVNTNDPLGVDEEITLTEGHNIVITEDAGAIEIKTTEDLTLNTAGPSGGTENSNKVIFKNVYLSGSTLTNGDNELYVDGFKDLVYKPQSNSAKRILHEGNIDTLLDDYNIIGKANTWTDVQTFDEEVVLAARALNVGPAASELLKFNYFSVTNPNTMTLFARSDGGSTGNGELVLENNDGTRIVLGASPLPSITTQSGTEVVNGVTYDSAVIDFEVGDATASVELIEGSNTQITNVSTGKIVINSRLRPVKVDGTQMLDANSLDTEDLDLTAGDNMTITEADGVVTFNAADITTATQNALDLKAPKANPTFTGTVTLPNTGSGTNEAATKSYVDGAINNAVFGDVTVEWVLEGEQDGETLPSGFNVFIDGITWDFANYDYKVVFDFETTAEDNDQPYMRFNGLSNTSTAYNYLYKRTSSVDDSVTVASAENTSLIYFGAALPSGSTTVGQTQYQGEFIIRRSVNGSPTSGSPIHNYSVRGFSSVTAVTAPNAGFTGYPVEATFVGNFGSSATAFTSIDIYSGITAGTTDYAKARIYKRAK